MTPLKLFRGQRCEDGPGSDADSAPRQRRRLRGRSSLVPLWSSSLPSFEVLGSRGATGSEAVLVGIKIGLVPFKKKTKCADSWIIIGHLIIGTLHFVGVNNTTGTRAYRAQNFCNILPLLQLWIIIVGSKDPTIIQQIDRQADTLLYAAWPQGCSLWVPDLEKTKFCHSLFRGLRVCVKGGTKTLTSQNPL